MGGVISQEHGDPPVLKPKTFWSQKLSAVQRNYPVIDKRMLSIVELLKEYRVTLLGHKIKIYADHKNLTYDGTIFQSDQLLWQHLLIDKYGAELIHIEGKKNVVANALSRLDMVEKVDESKINEYYASDF